jgi:hypothetical protein
LRFDRINSFQNPGNDPKAYKNPNKHLKKKKKTSNLTKNASTMEFQAAPLPVSLPHLRSRFLRACFEVLAEDQTLVLLYSGKVIFFYPTCSFAREAHGIVREEGDTSLTSHISWINPGSQWGDR